MARRLLASFAALLAACCCGIRYVASEKVPLNVDVYYESLCPDSIAFITKELGPRYDDLKLVVRVNLVPFGKSTWTGDARSEAGALFTCHHGQKECEGNIAQACAFDEINKSSAAELQQEKQVKVADCAMSKGGSAENVPECARKEGLSEESIERINSCSKSNQGKTLLVANGHKTKAFESPLKNVPAVVINGVKTQDAVKNFTTTICKHIPKNDQPDICTRA